MTNIKKKFNDKFPRLFRFSSRIYHFFIRLITGRSHSQIIFHKIYKLKNWGDSESVSGPGSNLKNTENLRKELPGAIKELNIKSLLDIPCGDFFWMKEINLQLDKYIGADIVEELVNLNNELYSDERRSFIIHDLSKDDLPEVDAIFCRDCLPHLSFKLIKASLRKIKSSGAKYFLTSSYTECKKNREIHVGGFRPLNMMLEPFYFPKPVKVIDDPCITEKFSLRDKIIGIWNIEEIHIK